MNWRKIKDPSAVRMFLRIETEAARVIWRLGLPDAILHADLAGVGDELLLTCVAHELRKRMVRHRIWQITHADRLLEGNPDYSLILGREYLPLRTSNILKRRRLALTYLEARQGREAPPAEHILAVLCRRAGTYGEIELRPWVYLSQTEAKTGRLAARQIAIQSVGHNAYRHWKPAKNWYHDRFQSLVDAVRKKWPQITLVQLGAASDGALHGVCDLRGKTSVRETAAILNRSLCFIGTSGLLVHLARAVECRSVVIYGGREHSWQSGYTCNENLDTFLPCAPCWTSHLCDCDRECMKRISPDQVLAAVERALGSAGAPLATDAVTIGSHDFVSHSLIGQTV